MSTPRANFVLLNVLGGLAVLGSYAIGLGTQVDPGRVWGGIPENWKPVYTTSMLLAAAGYFPFTAYLLLRVDPAQVRVGRWGFEAFLTCYAAILVGSALWMPLTFAMLDAPRSWLWLLIRLDLAVVGAGALGLLACLFVMRPGDRSPFFWAAVIGLLAFCWQTAVLDALVWPAYFSPTA